MIDVSLVSMPFAEVQRPSIALGLLQAALAKTEIRSEVVYGNLRFAETIGLVSYQAILSTPTDHLLGEWCFADGLADDFHPDDETYLDMVLEVRSYGFATDLKQRKDMMRWLRGRTSAYLDYLAESILARRPRIVGCSSVFQQHCASLALLKRIRMLSPETMTLMGGANCEGEMGVETLRAFPWIDGVVSGEADALVYDLCRLLLDHGRDVEPALLPYGAMTRAQLTPGLHVIGQDSEGTPRSMVYDLDSLPTPDYDTYFEAYRRSTLSSQIKPGLPAESSRGCWWGEKSHCTFCGLNGTGMHYRSKSPQRVLTELAELSDRYGIRDIQFVDNILDMSHLKTVLPQLAASQAPYALFYETKANLKHDQLQLLAQAGVHWIQPGIESLHDAVLKLIGKSNSAMMNLQLLKWASEFGIHVSWNMLCGFPGESDEWYADMAAWLPSIFHLQPPTGVMRVRYDRFSPYHMRPQNYGLTLAPSRAYPHIYPLPPDALRRLAYSFEDIEQPTHIHRALSASPGQQVLQSVVQQWHYLWNTAPPKLCIYDEGNQLRIVDTRPGAFKTSQTLDGLAMSVYHLCDSAQSPASLLERLHTQRGVDISRPEVDSVIERLCHAKIVLHLHGRLLSLGVAGDPPGLPHGSPSGSAGVHHLS